MKSFASAAADNIKMVSLPKGEFLHNILGNHLFVSIHFHLHYKWKGLLYLFNYNSKHLSTALYVNATQTPLFIIKICLRLLCCLPDGLFLRVF